MGSKWFANKTNSFCTTFNNYFFYKLWHILQEKWGGGVDKKCVHLRVLNVMSNNFISFIKYKLKKKTKVKE